MEAGPTHILGLFREVELMANVQKSKSVVCLLGAAGLLAAAGSALGQNCDNGVNPTQCNPMGTCNGPDVIVGDVNGAFNTTAVGQIEAFALGTTSCNIGNVWLNWHANTNQHPAISQTLFKMKTERYTTFEQLGHSWLKHGFFALSETLCCSGCQSTDGSHLGVHCADPYTASRNGSQSGLGPKWQINAATGVFPYPPANPPFSGTVARRLQVPVSSLEVNSATVLYFGACQYVVSDDAAAGNKYNNESYRQCTVTGSGTAWTLNLTGSTHRARQAIRAWGDNDTGVTYSDVFIPDDGLVIVASKATDLGSGRWHYEYAVQNMNSDRSIQSFSIPVPSGVAVTNIGFHDVAYHDGDGPGNVNYSSTDWTSNLSEGQISAGSITWSTEDFATNASANAIRWGTLYNFRFDANVAPADSGGVATMGLFKPGERPSIDSSTLPTPGSLGVASACDYNASGVLDTQHFFDFLDGYFAGAAGADFHNDSAVNSQDFFDVLACFFSPPQGC
jgi:hypothetical protein